MGDVCGVGPEIIAKAFGGDALYGMCRPVVIGDVHALEEALRIVGLSLRIRELTGPEEALCKSGVIDVISPVELDPANWHKGQVSRDAGRAAAEWVIEAVRLAVADRIDGIVTAPLNKEAMNSAGYA